MTIWDILWDLWAILVLSGINTIASNQNAIVENQKKLYKEIQSSEKR